jgi:hypothetical protein
MKNIYSINEDVAKNKLGKRSLFLFMSKGCYTLCLSIKDKTKVF